MSATPDTEKPITLTSEGTTAEHETTPLSKQYDTPLGLAHTTMRELKDRIKLHYDLASDYYLSLWGEHIHHGYWAPSSPDISKEEAQINLIRLLLETSQINQTPFSQPPLKILDVGCGIGGTSRFLARELGAHVTGITISSKQVQSAKKLSDSSKQYSDGEYIPLGPSSGQVRFIELDAETLGEYFTDDDKFDIVWISEALSHFPKKDLFFKNAFGVLKPGGKLVLADWFKDEGLTQEQFDADIKPIEDGMLLPPMCTIGGYVQYAKEAGLEVVGGPKDISQEVKKTWDISWSLIQNPSLWAFALSQGRDGIAFLQAFRAMRRGYANGSFRYAVMGFVKP
ncbi:S-adenosyl-L-methionine-dependent methyltransferase [Triangularia verruculosa]|uniref:S-adenosyl-L-methionine-dependent methyltransferase n=1 Tax=Triangularia verruculosa TaxID=2587418 RepID=A0AAN6XPB3_9PEZI|nr:S-adenosyl-L-methionine-dependent methyltransferase [Triangularia verruculosa]